MHFVIQLLVNIGSYDIFTKLTQYANKIVFNNNTKLNLTTMQ